MVGRSRSPARNRGAEALIEQVDVLVVGLGPGGGSAARTAAAGGLRVVGVDRRHRIGEPVQCAEFLPNPLKRHTQTRTSPA